MTDITGFTWNTRNKIQYVNVTSTVDPQKIVTDDEIVIVEKMDVEE